MQNKASRRKFIKDIGLSSIATGLIPASLSAGINKENQGDDFKEKESSAQSNNKNYSGDYLSRIAFPIGGMGAGMFCIEGSGAVSNMSVRNRPDVFNEPEFLPHFPLKELQMVQKF